MARLLLSAKASVDHQTNDGSTTLLLASFFDHREVGRLLLSANASVDKAKKDGMTPLCYASRDGRTEMASVLLAANASVDLKTPPLVLGCQEGHLDVVELLLSAGAGLNERAENGTTGFVTATVYNHLSIVRELLQQGADPSLQVRRAHRHGACRHRWTPWVRGPAHPTHRRRVARLFEQPVVTRGPGAAAAAPVRVLRAKAAAGPEEVQQVRQMPAAAVLLEGVPDAALEGWAQAGV